MKMLIIVPVINLHTSDYISPIFNKIAIEVTPQMAVDKGAIGLSESPQVYPALTR